MKSPVPRLLVVLSAASALAQTKAAAAAAAAHRHRREISSSDGPELFFSFYAAHGQQFKILEVYNPKPADVSMANYKLFTVTRPPRPPPALAA